MEVVAVAPEFFGRFGRGSLRSPFLSMRYPSIIIAIPRVILLVMDGMDDRNPVAKRIVIPRFAQLENPLN